MPQRLGSQDGIGPHREAELDEDAVQVPLRGGEGHVGVLVDRTPNPEREAILLQLELPIST